MFLWLPVVFRYNRIDEICPEKIVPTAAHFSCRSFCAPLDKSWAHSSSAQSHWCNLSWKKSCQQLCIFRVAPFAHRLTSLGRTVFRHNRIDAICPEKIVPTAAHLSCRSFCAPLDKSWAHSISAQSHWCNLSWKTLANSFALLVLLPANEAMHVPSPSVCTPLDKSWAHSFSAHSHWWNLS